MQGGGDVDVVAILKTVLDEIADGQPGRQLDNPTALRAARLWLMLGTGHLQSL